MRRGSGMRDDRVQFIGGERDVADRDVVHAQRGDLGLGGGNHGT